MGLTVTVSWGYYEAEMRGCTFVMDFSVLAQFVCPHAVTLGLKQRQEGVPRHPAVVVHFP